LGIKRFYDLRKDSEEPLTVRGLGKVLNLSKTNISYHMQIAEVLERCPELAQLPDAATALKAMKNALITQVASEMEKRLSLPEEVSSSEEGSTQVVSNKAELILAASYKLKDTFEGMAAEPSESFDLIDLDPPYGFDIDGIANDTEEWYEANLNRMLSEAFRLLKPNKWLIFWFGFPTYGMSLRALKKAGFEVDCRPVFWTKPGGTCRSPWSKTISMCDQFFLASKGKASFTKTSMPGVFPFSSKGALPFHPTSKPIPLLRTLFSYLTNPKDRLLVPFAGSGTSLFAARLLSLDAIGFDISSYYRNHFLAACQEPLEKLVEADPINDSLRKETRDRIEELEEPDDLG
jgi:site-specific DNA-methyltransferase (adenine-specific)